MSSLATGFTGRMESELSAHRGKVPLALKFQAERAPNGRVQMERIRTVRLLSMLILRSGLRAP